MSRIVVWFYSQNLWSAAFLMLCATTILAIIRTRITRNGLFRTFLLLALALWAAAVWYHTLGGRPGAVSSPACWSPLQSYRNVWNGANPELLRSNYMNVLLFYPAGVFWAALWDADRRHPVLSVLFVICACLFSTWIELTQYHCSLGIAETDDIIHNTLGAVLGILLYGLLIRNFVPFLRSFLVAFRQWLHS